jgi:radical SAM superfamily enzyme YgiQ (UPF0313 family)
MTLANVWRKKETVSDRSIKPAVVLVADRTLSADYKVLFEGIFATMQTRQVPQIFMRNFISSKAAVDTCGRTVTAPIGLRRVEAALLADGAFKRDDVVCTTPERLNDLLGPWVKIVGFSSSDPLGRGMSNTTTKNFWKGELYTRYWTRKMLERILEAKRKYHFKVVAGGAGAWQWQHYKDDIAAECIDVVFDGYFENLGPPVFEDLMNGNRQTEYISEKAAAVDKIKPIEGASLLGVVELSRGCGRGCRFCAMADKKMEHLSPDIILSDLQRNVRYGKRSVVSSSEDFFRYGGIGSKVSFESLCSLLENMRQVKGLSFMQIDHANITSAAQLNDEQLRKIRTLLTWEKPSDYLWANMGVESANGLLVAANSPGKISPFRPDDWQELVKETAEKMDRNGFFCVFSLILGLPGETPDDVECTTKLVEYFEDKKVAIFPIFYEPVRSDEIAAGAGFALSKMRRDHLELYRKCYEINFKQVPKLFWDNQRAGGVSLTKRTLMQLLGKFEVMSWRKTFKGLGKELAERPCIGEVKYA